MRSSSGACSCGACASTARRPFSSALKRASVSPAASERLRVSAASAAAARRAGGAPCSRAWALS
jgi:hypothetical protein